MPAVHYLPTHYAKRFGCGVEVLALVNREEDWSLFNKLRSTTWKEITCQGCLEFLYGRKKAELEQLASKLEVMSIVPGRRAHA